MHAKISMFIICVKAIIYICYYIICMTLPLTVTELVTENSNWIKMHMEQECKYGQ